MTRDQVKETVMLLHYSFPNWNSDNWKSTVDVWWMLLKDYPADKIMMAAKVCAASERHFAPSAGELIAMVKKPALIAEISESEAWEMVVKACSNSGYEYHEEFAKLPTEIQKAIGGERTLQAWALTRIDEFQTVIRSNFCRSYREIMSKKHEFESFTAKMQKEVEDKRKQILGKTAEGTQQDETDEKQLEDFRIKDDMSEGGL